jgi:hypothetical protein
VVLELQVLQAVMVNMTMLFIPKVVMVSRVKMNRFQTGAPQEEVMVDIKTPMLVQMLTTVGGTLSNVFKCHIPVVELEELVV